MNENMGPGEIPYGTNIIGSKLIFWYKYDADGKVIAYKTRLIVQGFSQAEGINYNETFSPTAKLSAIHVIAARNNWELEQTYVDGAYLNT